MKIALLGDIALIGRYDRTLNTGVSSRIQCVKETTRDCDYVIANLEAPFTSVSASLMCKGVYLRSDPMNVKSLREMGVTHVSLANNHTFDYGKKGARETCQVLEKAGIQYCGLGYGPSVLSKGSERVLLEGFCCLSANALGYGTKEGRVRLLTPETMEAFLRQTEKDHAFPIASVHFGLEGLHYPSKEHITLFRELAKKYDYVLHGNHPHAIQGVERFNNSLLVYAEGNLCFDEAKQTSIGSSRKEDEEERKCYITIIDIEQNRLTDYRTIGLEGLEDGTKNWSTKVETDLKKYSDGLKLPIDNIQDLRKVEIINQRTNAAKRDLRFFLNRLNYRYIGAYLNGRRHAKQYKEVFKDYL